MRTVTCSCGAVIPYRNLYEHYRLMPDAAEIRKRRHMGTTFSLLQRFMDRAEALTCQGQTILRFPPPATLGSRNTAAYRDILRRCERIGYLEYVCPACERAIAYPAAVTLRARQAEE